MAKKTECIAMLLAGGQGSRLYDLTKQTAKPAVSFGGNAKWRFLLLKEHRRGKEGKTKRRKEMRKNEENT